MTDTLIRDIESLLPGGTFTTAQESLVCYATDATRTEGRPDAVVHLLEPEMLPELVRIAAANGTCIVPRGAGTGLSGGCVPVQGGIVVTTERLKKIIDIDTVNLVAVTEPGVVTAYLHDAVESMGLFYPPDPASFKACTIGGNVAENAGGLRGLKYGVTRDYVMSLKLTLPNGKAIRTGSRTLKNVTGYDMTRLMVGSEGTLGFFTEISLKLIPKPEARASFLASYATLEAASEAVVSIIRSGVIPSTLEIMDEVTIRAVEEFQPSGREVRPGSLLLVEVDGSENDVKYQAERLSLVLKESGATDVERAANDAERDRLWAARRSALTALARVSPSVILEDATVPRSEIPAMVRAINGIAERYGLTIGTFGHAGDGNLHPTIITDLRNPEMAKTAHAAVADIFAAAIKLGGTLSGEHGIGVAKAKFMEDELGVDGVNAMRAIKHALDPGRVMNPGKMFTF